MAEKLYVCESENGVCLQFNKHKTYEDEVVRLAKLDDLESDLGCGGEPYGIIADGEQPIEIEEGIYYYDIEDGEYKKKGEC